nr:unnamed protein product [Callosobruchus chinensis]
MYIFWTRSRKWNLLILRTTIGWSQKYTKNCFIWLLHILRKKVRTCEKQYQLMKSYYPAFRHPSNIGAPKISTTWVHKYR